MGIMLLTLMASGMAFSAIMKMLMVLTEKYVIPNMPEWMVQALADPKGDDEYDEF